MQNNTVKILFIGDVFAEPGMNMCQKWLKKIKKEHSADMVIVNGENAAKDGRGLLEKTCEDLFEYGADIITTGNHVWRYDQFLAYLNKSDKVVRPANFPTGAPGKGYCFFEVNGKKIAVLNLMGRVFMKEDTDCPFRAADSILTYLKSQTDIIIVDFHAEATSEKQALAYYLDGRVSAVLGTHTHVQTNDARVLPGGTALMCDVGFCGAQNSCIGVAKETVIRMYLTQMPARFKPEKEGPFVLSGAIMELDLASGKALNIEPVSVVDN